MSWLTGYYPRERKGKNDSQSDGSETGTWEERTAQVGFQVVCCGVCGINILLHHASDTCNKFCISH